jgi:hypothetical protein
LISFAIAGGNQQISPSYSSNKPTRVYSFQDYNLEQSNRALLTFNDADLMRFLGRWGLL